MFESEPATNWLGVSEYRLVCLFYLLEFLLSSCLKNSNPNWVKKHWYLSSAFTDDLKSVCSMLWFEYKDTFQFYQFMAIFFENCVHSNHQYSASNSITIYQKQKNKRKKWNVEKKRTWYSDSVVQKPLKEILWKVFY